MLHPSMRPPLTATTSTAELLESRRLLSGTVTSGVTDLATGDFNGDGSGDQLVFARAAQARQIRAVAGIAGGRRSSLFLFDGADGSLLGDPVVVRSTGRGAPLVAVADLNHDGRADLVVSSSRSLRRGNLRILLGNGDGTFADAGVVAAPADVTAISTGDVNGDGNVDLVLTTEQSGRRTGSTGDPLAPDFSFQLQDSAGLLVIPATGGGVTGEAGGASSFGISTHPAVTGLDLTGLIGFNDAFSGAAISTTIVGSSETATGTFRPVPGVTTESGAAVSRPGVFGDTTLNGNGIDDSLDTVFVLLGNGAGGFTAA